MEPFVWFQNVDHSDGQATVQSYLAVVTGTRTVQADEHIVEDGSEIEVLSLTVFVPGGFEYYTNVYPWTDELGQKPSSKSYRNLDAKAPEVELK